MVTFEISKNDYIIFLHEIKNHKKYKLYKDYQKYLITQIDGKLFCQKFLQNLPNRLSKIIKPCAILDKWGI